MRTPGDGSGIVHSLWADLSFEDLEGWVGPASMSRGRGYQKKKRVLSLACSAEGVLSARVVGSAMYETTVMRDAQGRMSSLCTCPIGGHCKHAVALVLEYLEQVRAGKDIPTEFRPLPGRQPTTPSVETPRPGGSVSAPKPLAQPSKPPQAGRKRKKPTLEEYLGGLTAPDMVRLILELADISEDVRELLNSRAAFSDDEVSAVVLSLRKELARVSSERGWRHSCSGEGYTPDYGRISRYLANLLAAGQADLVLQLGMEVMVAGAEQVEMSDDEGDTAIEVTEALTPVWKALSRSSLTPAERILWLYDRYLEDECELCYGAEEDAGTGEVGPEAWNEVAEELLSRLGSKHQQRSGGDGAVFRREPIAGWAIEALQKAGRSEEAVELAVREAPVTHSYGRAVDVLIEAGRLEEAWALAVKGIEQTHSSLPGIASQLRGCLRDLAGRQGNQALEAAFMADEFFRHPSIEGYRQLREAAQRLEVWDAVHEQALATLRGGSIPLGREEWPLPDTGVVSRPESDTALRPRPRLLTEIALDEEDHVEALKRYGEVAGERFGYGEVHLGDEVAQAVATTHPDEAVAIWRKLAELHIGRAKREGYEESLRYLRPMRRLLIDSGRGGEWDAYLSALREEHRRKRTLLETLDTLRDGPILGG